MNKYLNPKNYLRYFFRNVIRFLLRKTKSSIDIRRNRSFLKAIDLDEVEPMPVFIIGPPRCGSTLFYQAMAHYFKFCFFTNEMMQKPYAVPLNIHKHKYSVEYESDFSSDLGRTEGKTAPHEAWPFWRRFYPRDVHDYIDRPDFLTSDQETEIAQTVKFLEGHYLRPFLAKNMEVGLRLCSVKRIFPQAIYIVIKRNPKALVSSLLAARIKINGQKSEWWSMRPASYEQLKNTSIMNQLVGQISDIYQTIRKDSDGLSLVEVSYEEFCSAPKETLEKIACELSKMGINLVRTSNSLPRQFVLKNTFVFSEEEERELDDLLQTNGVWQTARI